MKFKLNGLEFELEGNEATVKKEFENFKTFLTGDILPNIKTVPVVIYSKPENPVRELGTAKLDSIAEDITDDNYPILKEVVKRDLPNSETDWLMTYSFYASEFVTATFTEEQLKEGYVNTNRVTKSRYALNRESDKFENHKIHLNKALENASNKTNPDYRNSIKESLSAVETVLRLITQENTFGSALKKLKESGSEIDQNLKSAFTKLYAYSNNKSSGVRHAILDEYKSPQLEDAMCFLVSCSAFIKFILNKTIGSR